MAGEFQFRSGTPLDYGRDYTGFQTDQSENGGLTSPFGKTEQQRTDLFMDGFGAYSQGLQKRRSQLQFLSLVLGTGGIL